MTKPKLDQGVDYEGFDEASTPSFKVKERLIRIMGTFDLATGHANTFDELLDSLESELRDVLGHYREALAQPEQEPVGKFAKFTDNIWREVTEGSAGVPLYTTPPQRKPLTDEEMKKIWYAMQNIMGWYSFQEIARAIEAAHGIKGKA